ncbi:hypothetical protein TNCV_3080821 [Trichonephila clavipes]|nr:hypothetical protein TNCV_3080821 [Trichonephila clavipes]
MTLPADGTVFVFSRAGSPFSVHCFDCSFVSGVKCHVSSMAMKWAKILLCCCETSLNTQLKHLHDNVVTTKCATIKCELAINCQVIYSQFGLAIHPNDHQARRRFVEWAQNEIAVVPDFHKRILFSDEAHFWLNGYVNKQNCRIWSEANPQVYVETPLHPEKLTVWCALWAGGILLQKR